MAKSIFFSSRSHRPARLARSKLAPFAMSFPFAIEKALHACLAIKKNEVSHFDMSSKNNADTYDVDDLLLLFSRETQDRIMNDQKSAMILLRRKSKKKEEREKQRERERKNDLIFLRLASLFGRSSRSIVKYKNRVQ